VIWFAIPALAAAVYYLLALIAAASRTGDPEGSISTPPISILKPIHGRDPHLYDGLSSHASQNYPAFEILFGVSDPNDAAIDDIRRLQSAYPAIAISLHIVRTTAPNAKAGVLAELARHARHPVLLVNDSDIKVPPNYLRDVTALLADPQTGLVTCLYRAAADSWPSRAEALGIATEFAPSVLVARLLGVAEFALGSTMAFRAETLQRIGGFETISQYLADDYQLGRHISQLGYRIRFASPIVETNLGCESWLQVWRHQVRWSRTIRVSRASGYYGYVVTHAALWALVAVAAGVWWAAALALGLRMIAGIWIGAATLQDRKTLRYFWMIPLRDVFGFAIWIAGLFGNTVVWRGQTLHLRPDGRIAPSAAPSKK
jgi:ceramide glucosyltransferase